MLLNNKDILENDSDFTEINDNLATIQTFDFSNSQNGNEEKNDFLPLRTRLLLFLWGFSYTGILAISVVIAMLLMLFTNDETVINVALEALSYSCILGILLYVIRKYKKKIIPLLKDPKGYLRGLGFGIATFFVEIVLSSIIYNFYPSDTNANQALIESMINSYPTIMILVACIIGPICEELTYRVGLFGIIRKKNELLGIVISSLVFGLVHLSFTSTDLVAEFVALPIYIAIGACLTYAYKKYGFTCSFVAHAFINLISVLVTIFL